MGGSYQIRRLEALRTRKIRAEMRRRNAEADAANEARRAGKMIPGGAPENKALAGAPENKAPEKTPRMVSEDFDMDPVAGVPFASTAAYTLAFDNGLTAIDFAGKEWSGKTGFTLADVRAMVGA